MKRIIIMTISGILFYSCATSESKTEAEMPTTAPIEAIILNAGNKWKSDSATNENVKRLHTLSIGFANHEMAEYRALAATLQDGLNKMIRECRMKGKEHEALHQWLEPFAKSVKELSEANEVSQARKIFGEIQSDLEAYSKYFD